MAELKLEEPLLRLEENVPLPQKSRPRYSELGKMLDSMKVGQCIFIPLGYMGRAEPPRLRAFAGNAASTARKRDENKNKVYTSTLVDGGARIWRLK